MRIISQDFTYPIWDEWRTNSFTQGRTGTFTYDGPEFLTFEVQNDSSSDDYGKESGWCLWRKNDLERPAGADIMRVTVDCKANPLLCEIGNDTGKESGVQMRREREWEILWDAPDGYQDVEYTANLEPRDVYDEWNITWDFTTNEFVLGVHDWAATGANMNLTWEEVRDVRDDELHATDAKVGQTDAPDSIQQVWLDYRQRLRDHPAVMTARGYEPWQAVMMFPVVPKDMRDPSPSSDPADPYRDGAFAVDVAVAGQKAAGKK
tara:strand:- start:2007 stop:2795 length:789 start_codon:yes stop_codon:yes gene_type:complete